MIKDNVYHVGCSTDDNYIHHCATMVCSLLENNKDIYICVHLLYEILSFENRDFLKQLVSKYNMNILFHKIDSSLLDGVRFRIKRPLSKAAYYRLLLSSILSDVDKVLYLDVDMVVLRSIKPLFEINIEKYALAAVADVVDCIDPHRMQLSLSLSDHYFCSALMIINLSYWRNHGSETKLIEFAKRDRFIYCHDQDCLNYVFKNSWFELPPKWNKFNMAYLPTNKFRDWFDIYEYNKNPCIIHFSAYRPEYKCFFIRFEKYYKEYLYKSEVSFPATVRISYLKRWLPVCRYLFYRLLYSLSLMDLYKEYRLGSKEKLSNN